MAESRHRLKQVEPEHVTSVMDLRLSEISRSVVPDGSESRYLDDPMTIADAFSALAMFGYAGGAPLEDIRGYCEECAKADIAAYQADWDEYDQDDDWSCSSLRHKFLTLCQLLLAGETQHMAQLTQLMAHPPFDKKVDYGGWCSANEEAMAFALREMVNGLDESAREHLGKFNEKRAKIHEKCEAGILSAMLDGNPEDFLASLRQMLKWNASRVTRKNIDWNKHFLCIPGLGLSALAVRRGLLSFDDLPQDDMHFPVDLLRLSFESGIDDGSETSSSAN